MWAILDENNDVVRCSTEEYLAWEVSKTGMEKRRIGRTKIKGHVVSTVFLGLDHGYGEIEIWFETMVFDQSKESEHPNRDLDAKRYMTWDGAVAGHAEFVKKWKAKLNKAKPV